MSDKTSPQVPPPAATPVMHFKMREYLLMEESTGIPMDELPGQFGKTAKATCAMLWVLLRREQPDAPFETVLDMPDDEALALMDRHRNPTPAGTVTAESPASASAS